MLYYGIEKVPDHHGQRFRDGHYPWTQLSPPKYSLPLPIKQFSFLPLLIILEYALILELDIGP